MENPRQKKSLIEEKKIHCQKLVQEGRDASFYYISINIITLNLIHHHIYICGRVINKVSPYHGGLPSHLQWGQWYATGSDQFSFTTYITPQAFRVETNGIWVTKL